MAQLISTEHVSPACIKIKFNDALRNNADLRDTASYVVSGSVVVAVRLPYAQAQEWDPLDPEPKNGGTPEDVYVILAEPPMSGSVAAGLSAAGAANILDFDGANLVGVATILTALFDQKTITYWTSDGTRTEETFTELGKLGRARFTETQPLNYSTAHMLGKLNDLLSGGLISSLGSALPGPAEPTTVTTFSPAGFAPASLAVPGIGDPITFKDGLVPYHVDKLWGNTNGDNKLFRASLPFHPFECVLVVAAGRAETADNGIVDSDRWYAPNNGQDRQIMMLEALPKGTAIIAIYLPRKSLIRIGEEIIAYDEMDIDTRQGVIHGRAQLMSQLVEHDEFDIVEDVWATSFVAKAEINMLAFGASGRPLEYIGQDHGSPRSDNPTLNDTNLRRMIFHTSVNMRGVPGTMYEAIRYIYPQLWGYIIVGEDPRWPGCVTIWFSNDDQIGDRNWITSPSVEPWETWLDHISWPDGMPLDLLTETYYRDDAVDDGFYGDYWLWDATEDPVGWAYPVVISGSIVSLLGAPAPVIPPPFISGATIDTTYRSYIVRPPGFDKVLPAGCGVLLLDTALL